MIGLEIINFRCEMIEILRRDRKEIKRKRRGWWEGC